MDSKAKCGWCLAGWPTFQNGSSGTWHSVPEPVSQVPCEAFDIPNNYESPDCPGVLTGNSDLGVPERVPTKVEPGTTPLPIYPTPSKANVPEKKS